MKNLSFSSCFLTFCPGRCVWGGHMCVWGRHMCVLGRPMCVLGRHMCVLGRLMCVWERPSRCYILIFPSLFFFQPFFSGSCLCFFKIPFFPPIENFHPPRCFSKPWFYILIFPSLLFFQPFCFWVLLMFFQNSLFPL